MPLDVARARAVFTAEVAEPSRARSVRGRLRLPRARQREHDPGHQVGDRPARPRPARLHARRIRWERPDPRGRDRPRARHPARPRPAAAGRLLGRRSAPGSTRMPRQADVPAADAPASTRTSWRSSSRASRPTRARASARSALRDSAFEFESWAEMRYVGQGFELPIPLPPPGLVDRVAGPPRGRVRGRARADLRPPDRQPDRDRPPAGRRP